MPVAEPELPGVSTRIDESYPPNGHPPNSSRLGSNLPLIHGTVTQHSCGSAMTLSNDSESRQGSMLETLSR